MKRWRIMTAYTFPQAEILEDEYSPRSVNIVVSPEYVWMAPDLRELADKLNEIANEIDPEGEDVPNEIDD